ncbi:hypothetical protein NMG60_11003597, partial [Bertholletia excelsa]
QQDLTRLLPFFCRYWVDGFVRLWRFSYPGGVRPNSFSSSVIQPHDTCLTDFLYTRYFPSRTPVIHSIHPLFLISSKFELTTGKKAPVFGADIAYFSDENQNNTRTSVTESLQTKEILKDDSKQHLHSSENVAQSTAGDLKGGIASQSSVQVGMDESGEVNMEASISSDDVIRAGGFGARDDIGSFLPVASDSTDFEASLRDARDYEDPPEEICRPGLGWIKATK